MLPIVATWLAAALRGLSPDLANGHRPSRPAPMTARSGSPRRPPRPRFYISLIAVTFGATAFAVAFRYTLEQIYETLYGAGSVVAAVRAVPVPARALVPAVGALLAGGATTLAVRRSRGRGVGEVMEAVVVGGRPLSLPATSWRALGSWSAIASGGSIGREGPLIQFGAALASTVGDRLDVSDHRRRALVGSGAAAGFAAAYNTPLAAVLFVVEVITGVQALGVVLPVMLAAAVASAATSAAIGPGPLYGSHPFTLVSQWELVLYVLLGVGAALVGIGFMWLLRTAERWFRKLTWPRPARAALGGLLVGAIVCVLPDVAGNGYEPIREILAGASLPFVAWFLVAKAAATSASVGGGSPGGVFTPTMALGAALGLGMGRLFDAAISADIGSAGGYALVGMAAILAATTHAPLMAAVLVFELSGDYAIVLPLLVASATATAVARHLEPLSIYMQELRESGLYWEMTLDGRRIVRTEDDPG